METIEIIYIPNYFVILGIQSLFGSRLVPPEAESGGVRAGRGAGRELGPPRACPPAALPGRPPARKPPQEQEQEQCRPGLGSVGGGAEVAAGSRVLVDRGPR